MKRRAMLPLFVVVLGLLLAACGGGSKGPATYEVSGVIVDGDGEPMEGVTLTFSEMTATAETDAKGRWSQAGLRGSVTVTPVFEAHTFEPASAPVSSETNDVDFVGTKGSGSGSGDQRGAYKISGTVLDEANDPINGVMMRVTGANIDSSSITPEADGTWEAPGLKGEVTVTPQHDGYTFSPSSLTFSGAATATFTGTKTTTSPPVPGDPNDGYAVSGTVTDENGVPVPDVVITLKYVDFNESRETTTEIDGSWNATGVGTVNVTVGDPAYAFAESEHTVSEAATDINFRGTLQACSEGHPINSPPCVMTRIQQVQKIGDYLAGHYALGADIDAAETLDWNNGEGFEPIGVTRTSPFVGTFEGNDHEIRNLYINRPEQDSVGLFAHVGRNGQVENIHIVSGEIIGRERVGAIAGVMEGTLHTASNYASVQATESAVGGLVGANAGLIRITDNYGPVDGPAIVGGIVGVNIGTINMSANGRSGEITALLMAGGIAGTNNADDVLGTIQNTRNEANIEAQALAGGISAINEGHIIRSANNGHVTVEASGAGGITARNSHQIEHVENDGNITALGQGSALYQVFAVGGIAGEDKGTLLYTADNFGEVRAEGQVQNIGGIVGKHEGDKISVVHNEGEIFGEAQNIGGIVGYTSGGIREASNTGWVWGGTGRNVGGIAGVMEGAILRLSYNTGRVASAGDYIGGIAGAILHGSDITTSFNEGNVFTSGAWVGGVTGLNSDSIIENSYNRSNVHGGGDYVGGLVGQNGAAANDGTTVARSYSVGSIEGAAIQTRGGLVGTTTAGSVSASFFDEDKVSRVIYDDSAKSTEEMMQKSTYVGWDFHHTWHIAEGRDYPVLQKNMPPEL